mgnify:CR=1 FL=1
MEILRENHVLSDISVVGILYMKFDGPELEYNHKLVSKNVY